MTDDLERAASAMLDARLSMRECSEIFRQSLVKVCLGRKDDIGAAARALDCDPATVRRYHPDVQQRIQQKKAWRDMYVIWKLKHQRSA
jgi:iron-sulfur cluster repair protein YtfE (RIC family)